MGRLRVVIASEIPMVSEGIRASFEKAKDIEVAGCVCSADELIDLAGRVSPDLVVIDTGVCGNRTSAVASQIKKKRPETAIIAIVPSPEDKQIPELIRAGLNGIILRNTRGEELVQVVQSISSGKVVLDNSINRLLLLNEWKPKKKRRDASPQSLSLTDRQREILEMTAGGMGTRDIAAKLGVSEHTVKSHFAHLFDRWGIGSRTEAVLLGLKSGVLSLSDVRVEIVGNFNPDPDTGDARQSVSPDRQLADAVQVSRAIEENGEGSFLIQDERFVSVNRRMAELLGYAETELVGKPFLQIVLPDIRKQIRRMHRARLSGVTVPTYFDMTVLRKDGETLFARFSVSVIPYGAGKAVVGVIHPVEGPPASEELFRSWLTKLDV